MYGPYLQKVSLSFSQKLYDILQCKLLDIRYGQNKINDFIHCVEGHRTDEHFIKILNDTAAVIEQTDDSDVPPRKKVQRCTFSKQYSNFCRLRVYRPL